MPNDFYVYSISEHFMSAIINDDRTGLDDDEEQDLKDFLDNLPTSEGIWDIPNDETNFTHCDICNMYAECMTVKLWFHNKMLAA